MAENKKKTKKPFNPKDNANKGKRFDKKPKPDKKSQKDNDKKPENKGEFKCRECGGQLVRRWIFPSIKEAIPFTQLVCENCGTATRPRDIKYAENGLAWGTSKPKKKTEKKTA